MDYKTVYDFSIASFKIGWIIILVVILFSIPIYFGLRDKKSKKNIIAIGYFIFISIIFLGLVKVQLIDFYKTKSLYKEGKYKIIEGTTEQFVPVGPAGKRKESFYINDVFFNYSHFDSSYNGFNKTSLIGGPINKNGQQVRLCYITKDTRNIILKIELKSD